MTDAVSPRIRRALSIKPGDSYLMEIPPGAAGKRDYKPAGNYDGKELKPFEGRVGAMDAFKLPSGGC